MGVWRIRVRLTVIRNAVRGAGCRGTRWPGGLCGARRRLPGQGGGHLRPARRAGVWRGSRLPTLRNASWGSRRTPAPPDRRGREVQRSPLREDRGTPEARSPGPGVDPARNISESCVLTGERQARRVAGPGRGPVPRGTRAHDSDVP